MEKYTNFDINQALEFLKDNYVLSSYNSNVINYFWYKNKMIVVSNKSFNVTISEDDFKEIYKESKFNLIENSDNEIDLEK